MNYCRSHEIRIDKQSLIRKGLISIVHTARTMVNALVRWHLRRSSIRELESLSDNMLKDIGVYRGEIPALVDVMLTARMRDSTLAEPVNILQKLREDTAN